jgi:hypothetical protein
MIRCGAFCNRRWPCCVGSVLRRCRLLILADRRGVVQSRLRHSGRKSLASTIVSFTWHRATPREYPSIGLLCEADLTKPDIIETAAGDP